jgi:hypothetical protein
VTLRVVPGAERAADAERRVVTRVQAREGEETGGAGCPPASTPFRVLLGVGYDPRAESLILTRRITA